MPSRPLPACTDGVGLGVVHFHPGRSGLPRRTFHARVGTSPGCFFHLPKGETMEGGREDKFLFSFRIEWHSGGTRHWGEGGASLCLNYYAKKQNKKKQLALYIVEGGPSPRLRVFTVELGGRPPLGPCLLQPVRGFGQGQSRGLGPAKPLAT